MKRSAHFEVIRKAVDDLADEHNVCSQLMAYTDLLSAINTLEKQMNMAEFVEKKNENNGKLDTDNY